ncbi:MAG TPA: YfcE family phosphodiesterase [Bacteroidales bacterium]|nr:MAG: YfcE family phosphodiesterase [Bacteroidetes bacterium GWF2_33_38]OFY74601.1 MAG: YfcE family phosphodiesterase [Bacteroidetes bacterium RIFOXYA12_FULL_33_9]HBF87585.1 YfcE family phosphodiesterase [Bacteroidales bacterium]
MKQIGLLSDTHGTIDERIFSFFKDCDEIWHAGDIGNITVYNKLNESFLLRAVYGNIDGTDIRQVCKPNLFFRVEDIDIFMTHIGGYPKHYDAKTLIQIKELKPSLFICGHSHILKVMYDNDFNMMCMNPGAYGKYGFHVIRTAIRFSIDGKALKNLEVLEIPRQ